MKKRLIVIPLALLLSIVSSIVWPAWHALGHIAKDFDREICVHASPDGKAQITHEHSHLDHCYVCGFSFSHFLSPSIAHYWFAFPLQDIPYFKFIPDAPDVVPESAHPRRGPPDFSA